MDWLDPLDAAMLTAEISNPLNIGAVLMMSTPPGAGTGYLDELYRQDIAGRDPLDPRLRRFPYRGIETGGVWVWREADAVDLSQHCQRRILAPGAGRDDLWRLISELHADPLDRSRPMWMSYLIDGFDNDHFALYIKLHHTVMDGVAGFQMISDALSPDPRQRAMPAFYADRHTEPDAPLAHKGLRMPNPFPVLRSLVDAATSGVALAERVVTGEIANVVASLTADTTVAPLAAPYMRFNEHLGRERAVAAASWPKARIRALQDKAGVTSNDAVTAVVAGALRQWLLDHQELPEQPLVAICPITVRGHEHAAPDSRGNMFGAWLCPLGTNVDDPAERLDLIHRSMAEGKRQVANRGAAASLLLLATSIAPTVLLPMLPFAPKGRRGYNLPISHVPGPATEMYWNGAHVEEIYPVSAVYDGQAVNVTTCSYADRIGFGYVAGRNVITDIGTLIPLTEQSLTELEAAVGVQHGSSR
jgi:WS/DGAT/MGAT family acyltransferase